LRLGKAGEPNLTAAAPEPFEFGKVRLIREGTDICIISYGPVMKMAWEIAERIEREQGRSVALVSAHTVKPLDNAGVKRILDTYETVAVIEEHSPRGSLGGQVKQLAWDASAKCRLVTFSLQDEFIHQFGSQKDLWMAHGLDPEIIYQQIISRS
jgi:transketolase